MKGTLIAIEGIDGSGKSTIAKRLSAELRERGWAVLLTREPGGTRVGEDIRQILLDDSDSNLTAEAEALLFAASRAQLVGEVIKPALEKGTVVIVDRFVDSSLAYQGGGRGLDLDALEQVQRFATGGLRPEMRILLDISPEVALRRRRGSESVNRLDSEELAFYERVRQTYLKLATAEPSGWCIVEAGAEPDAVWRGVWGCVVDHLEANQPEETSRQLKVALPS